MKTIILLTALLLPIQAHATGFLLFDEFGTPPSVDWIGIYSPLSVLIGTCVDPLRCTYQGNLHDPAGDFPPRRLLHGFSR